MAITPVVRSEFSCDRCGHVWEARRNEGLRDGYERREAPRACPKCHTDHWNDGGANGRKGKG